MIAPGCDGVYAGVAELVDALVLGTSIVRCGGSSPSARTNCCIYWQQLCGGRSQSGRNRRGRKAEQAEQAETSGAARVYSAASLTALSELLHRTKNKN